MAALVPGVALLAASVAMALLTGGAAASPLEGASSKTFGYQQGSQTFRVPTATYYLAVEARGGYGGSTDHTPVGGPGGEVETVVPVHPGQEVEIFVGQYGVADGGRGWVPGGRHGYAWGPSSGHSGAGGGGATGIAVQSSQGGYETVVVAGGGGGGGGNDGDGAVGGAGGAGGLPAEPGSPGWNSDNEPNQEGLHGGCGGCQSQGAGSGGEHTSFSELHGGGGGAGGGGWQGGGGGDNGVYRFEQVDDIGGSGGGGGSSWVSSSALQTKYSRAETGCDGTQPGPECQGQVVLSWGAPPADLKLHSGNGGKATVERQFSPVSVLVTDARGIPVPAAQVFFDLPGSGASGTFPDGSTFTARSTGVNGIATAPPITANGTAGEWSGQISVTGLSKTAAFSMTNVAAASRTAVSATPNPARRGEEVAVSAQVTSEVPALPPTGAVLFKLDGAPLGPEVPLDGSGHAELPASQMPSPAAGTHRIEADYLGDAGHTQSVGSRSLEVERFPVAISLEAEPNPSSAGQIVVMSAGVDPVSGGGSLPLPTGTVEFSVEGGGPLGDGAVDSSGQVELLTDALPLGDQKLVASYSGDANYAPATGTAGHSVGDESTSTVISSSANPARYGELPTWTAEARRWDLGVALSGTIGFTLDGEQVCPPAEVDASGSVECQPQEPLAAGPHQISASYEPPSGSGDLPSTGHLSQLVVAARTTVAVSGEPEPSVFGEEVELTAEVTAAEPPGLVPRGEVTFSSDGRQIGMPALLDDGVAHGADRCAPGPEPCDLEPGVHALEAEYQPAGENFGPSHGFVLHRVEPAATEVRVAPQPGGISAGSAATFSAVVSAARGAGVPYGRVHFAVDGESIGEPVSIVGGRAVSAPISTLREGEHEVTARFAGSVPFEPSEDSVAFTVGPPNPDVGTPAFAIEAERMTVNRRGKGRVRVFCHGERGASCTGRLVLRTAGPALALKPRGAGRAEVPLGRKLAVKRVSVPTGESLIARPILSHKGERVVSATKRLRGAITIRPEPGTAQFARHRLDVRAERAPAARLRGKRLRLRGRSIAARVRCARGGDACRVRVRLQARSRPLAIGGRRVRAGRAATVRLRVRPWARRALQRRSLRAEAQVRSVLRVGIPAVRSRKVVIR